MRYPGKRLNDLHNVEPLWTWIPVHKSSGTEKIKKRVEPDACPPGTAIYTDNRPRSGRHRVPRDVTAGTMSRLTENAVTRTV